MSSLIHRLLWPGLPAAAAALLAVGLVRQLIEVTEPAAAPVAVPSPSAAAPTEFLQRWCFDCHGGGAAKGGLAMDDRGGLTGPAWENIRRHVVLRTMPPQDEPSPPPAARAEFEVALLDWQASQPPVLSAPPVFRRLSRREFSLSLLDLIGTAPDPQLLPEEESAHGFDNNADLQPLPPTVMERYAVVTRESVRAALLPAPVPVTLQRFMPQEFTGSGCPSADAPGFHETETDIPVQIAVTCGSAGTYRLRLKAYAHQAGSDPVRVRIGQAPPQALHSRLRNAPEVLSTDLPLPAGPAVLTFQLANPFRDPRHPDPHRRTRRLLTQEVSLEGPLEGDATPTSAFLQRFGPLVREPASLSDRLRAADGALTSFARRAWRRPLSSGESSRLTHLAGEALAHGLRYDEAIAVAVQAILTSPNFLFMTDPAAVSPAQRPYALASRLSYLLWSTLPDQDLLTTCGQPWTPVRLRTAAVRLLEDPRATAFARDFAGQWLQLRNTTLSRPDPDLFPQATPMLLESMQESAERFFLHLVRTNEPVLRLLDADYAFLDPAMAGVLGVPGFPSGSGFRQVRLPDPQPCGLLGQPALLLLTSYPNRTSPVRRGKFILESLLGLEPPPPPPNVPTLQPMAGTDRTHGSIRAALESHRTDPSCASCHQAIDPMGFPLEAFDAIGRPARDPAADLSGRTFTGHWLGGPAGLQAWLTGEQGTRIVHHAAERLMTYALGRGLTASDKRSAHRMADQNGGRHARFRDLLMAIITSPEFSALPVSASRSAQEGASPLTRPPAP